jgi:hypothetical protein
MGRVKPMSSPIGVYFQDLGARRPVSADEYVSCATSDGENSPSDLAGEA